MTDITQGQAEDKPMNSSKSPYQLDLAQTTKACKVLQQHIDSVRKEREANSKTRDILGTDSGPEGGDQSSHGLQDIPLWMIFTGKKHIVDRTRLKPNKIQIPHPLNTDGNTTICLITSDPQRLYKDTIAHPAFPEALRARITRVIGFEKLKACYKSYESKRQLASEYDFFFADSRIWTYLPKILGKIFFQGGAKRPIPVDIEGPKALKQTPGQPRRSTKGTSGNGVAKPQVVAKELQKALNSAVVHLSTSNTTAVRVASAAMTPAQAAANIEAVVTGMTSKLLPQGWRNVRAMHVKGPNTPALPIWLASELWDHEDAVLEERKVPGQKRKREVATRKASLHEKGDGMDSKRSAKIAKTQPAGSSDGVEIEQAKTAQNVDGVKSTAKLARRSQLKKQKTNIVAEADRS